MQAQTHPSTPLRYRPDIDGLRAVAVLAVVFFHLRLPFVTGGYVGVDVFFVISGYLISAIIMREIGEDRFSIVRFYERRVRRIFPALLVMLLVVLLAAAYLLPPNEVMAFARTLLAALYSGSNFIFWHQAGYFDDANGLKPLLHTWSLAVEEQFYLLFPPFLLLLRRFAPRRIKAAIFLVAIDSFAASLLVITSHTDAAFYFTPLRAWELMLGTILSQRYLPSLRTAATRNIASLAGLALLIWPIFFYRETTLFPGLSALPPCLGAGLVIAAGETGASIAGRLLSWRPIVFIGLISYSLYLWHWPVMVFQLTNSLFVPYRFNGRHLTGPVLLVISLALATLSWAYVERPFRDKRVERRPLFLGAAIATGLLTIAAIALIALDGLPSRYPPEARAVAVYLDYPTRIPWRGGECFLSPENGSFEGFRKDVCLAQTPGRGSVLLLGDSHAASMYPGMKAAFADRDVLQANVAGCRALLHESVSQSSDCKKVSAMIFGDFLLHHHVDWVILAGRWPEEEYKPLAETLDWLRTHGIPTVVAGRNSEYDIPLPHLIANRLRNPKSDPPDAHFRPVTSRVDKQMTQLSRTSWHGAPYVSFFDTFCASSCPIYAAPGVPMLFDGSHLTYQGGKLFDDALRARILSLEANRSSTR